MKSYPCTLKIKIEICLDRTVVTSQRWKRVEFGKYSHQMFSIVFRMVRAVIRALKCENCIKLSAKHGKNINLWSMQFGSNNSGP